jgi:hypothetical protein
MQDNAEEDVNIREAARKVLSEVDCYGDSYGVPSIVDIVEFLVERIMNEGLKCK